MPLAELEQSFAEKFAVYLKHVVGIADTTTSVWINSLKYVIKKAFNDGQIASGPNSGYVSVLLFYGSVVCGPSKTEL